MRILIIGEKKFKGSTLCIDWEEITKGIPALGDYEHVFINLQSLTITSLARITPHIFARKIVEALNANTRIYVLTAPSLYANGNSTYSIFPFLMKTVKEEGEAFQSKHEDEYFKYVKKWGFYLSYKEGESWRYDPVLKTRHGFDICVQVELQGAYGFLYFFPPQTVIHGEGSFKNLFKYLLSDKEEEMRLPDFIDKLLVSGESELSAQIDTDEETIETLSGRVKVNVKKLQGIKSKKGILAFKGKPLEDAVGRVLDEMGFPLNGLEIYEEDGMLDFEGNTIPVEIKGHDKGMGMDDLRQIIQRGPKAKTKKEVPVKGVLIGNPYASLPLEKRGKDFEPNLIKGAEPFGICLLSTRVLFEYWKEYLSEGKSLLKRKLLSTVGLLEFEPLPPSES